MEANQLKAGGYTFTRDGRAEWIGDAHHRGTEVLWSEHRNRWVFADLENETLATAERIAAVRCNGDPDEGLNQHCLACDLDGAGLWIVDAEYLDDCESGYLEIVAVDEDPNAVCDRYRTPDSGFGIDRHRAGRNE